MPEQFVNPSPHWCVSRLLFFDFPCEGVTPVVWGTYRAQPDCSPNINLTPPVTEAVYGQLGTPPCEQGHPFMKEFPSPEAGDPASVDQIVDIDRGLQVDHTGRLSGTFVHFIAHKPFYSQVEVSAVAVAPAGPPGFTIATFTEWLTPEAMAPNVWFRRAGGGNELLFSAHVVIPPGGLSDAGFLTEHVYKLVYQWRFYHYTGSPVPADPPADLSNSHRMPISGFDEAVAFEVIPATFGG